MQTPSCSMSVWRILCQPSTALGLNARYTAHGQLHVIIVTVTSSIGPAVGSGMTKQLRQLRFTMLTPPCFLTDLSR